jgi:hypothetical protein
MNALTYPDGAQALRMSRQVLDGKLITVNQSQFAFGPSYEGTRLGLNISIAPPLATTAAGTKLPNSECPLFGR